MPLIVNTAAGGDKPQEWLATLEARCRERGLDAQVLRIDGGDHLLAAAGDAVQQGARLVIAGGGDGTVSAVASRLADTDTALGVLPLGTLNHFAKDLGIPLELDAAIDVIAGGREVRVDVGEVNGHVFINNSSLGLYPDIVLDRERQRRRLGRGKWTALLAAAVHAARRYPVLSVRIGVNGEQLERRSAFVFIGNNEYKMEGFEIGERARLSGGELSLYVTQRTGRFGLLRLALRALAGRLRQASDFDMLTAPALVVRTPQRQLRVAIDGEVRLLQVPLNYRIRPGALRVRVPPAAQ
ncbi:MAG: diacylglycerol kinase family protein [Ramlibacter sp.]